MITRLLVANRAEIARRIFRTCRALGIGTVAVFSDADTGSPHAAEADQAVRLPGARPADTYLSVPSIIEAARAAGADAVHPGYGFLSENAEFARAVLDAGLTWVGPAPEAIAAMGSKIEAKELMGRAGVPLLPSLDPEDEGLTFPVLVKASAGGGGRGMRTVRDAAELAEAVAAARREAAAAFGDGAVFVEPLLEDARHIEVQVLADTHGTVWTLGERDCSIQRRHQKVVEETPAPGLAAGTRALLLESAARAATAIGYVGAGTVEFLVKPGPSGDTVAFLEMNTRLQVEHPVTECVYGLDLVRLQLEIAEGARLPADPPAPSGHAIEVRLYAEDPADGWRPGSGPVHLFDVPGVDTRFTVPDGPGPHLRLDSGVETGSHIGVHYDPMLAKLIATGPTRSGAARRLATALATSRLHGPATNRDLLVGILRHPSFLAGDVHTGFLTRHDLHVPGDGGADLAALAGALALAAGRRATAKALGGLPSGWRNVVSQPQRTAFEGPAGRVEVAYLLTRDGLVADGHEDVRLVSATATEVVLETGGVVRRFAVAAYEDTLFVDSPLGSIRLTALPRLPAPEDTATPGSLLAPMPGTVLRVEVTPGTAVTAGQPILTLEAMKMEHQIKAPTTGVVTTVGTAPGHQVEAGAVLAVIEEA
ncbi:biotin carboxylase N-terminal domain-containing protein [Sphaerisporangium rubeum]|uniref:Propionyl-CoA carboxylase alpha chain n=1 Tax=Sphaerisporangium rubeum TaxID=321317 RepID=A0A7X0IEG5_9ACTN|nr:biotin carboxylase N-terminal domain-containing protein [Sphaerisporangium rubeum]MBB6473064.1 propionyl-CoA carboxylase alpha chain [Sphaerisporangium rubeum]